jgi:arginyl-tRNA synthetase
MSVFVQYQSHVAQAIDACIAQHGWPEAARSVAFTLEPPRDPSHGDLAVNAAMVLGKTVGQPPRAIAEKLAEALRAAPGVAAVEIAGPGFLNLRLAADVWRTQVLEMLSQASDYGRGAKRADAPVNVEYVSANPTGPMHMGHCRGAVIGDALANLLAFAGFAVTREYYINDAGSQVDTLARSAHLRYQEALGRDIGEIPEGFYPGDYLIPVGQALAEKFGSAYLDKPESDWLKLFKRETVAAMMERIKTDLAVLGIRHEVFFSEMSLHESGVIDRTLADLEQRDLVYTGVLDKPKGEVPDDWEPRPQTLFRATAFGDDTDRPLKKSDGSYTYFAADIAYHKDKVDRGFRTLIDIWGADHGGYVKRMASAVTAVSQGEASLNVRLCQMVRLFRGGEPVKMSKRSGSFVTLADVVEEVGKDVVRFMMLTRKNDAQLDFDFAKVQEQSRDNPVFYVQYAHARVCSVLRNVKDFKPSLVAQASEASPDSLSRLVREEELALVKMAAQWPRVVEGAVQAFEPHRIAFYLYDLAAELHGLWNKGNDDPSLRFLIRTDDAVTTARLSMLMAVAQVIKNGLGIMGVEPVEEMH